MNIKLMILLLWSFSLTATAQPDEKTNTTKAFVLGNIETLHSEILKEERTLNIYLPEGYNDSSRYPVIYLLDGSADEDFIHIVGLVQYNTFSWINRIPKSIVVGIANTNRKKDFTFPTTIARNKEMVPVNGGAEQFISFIQKELQPFIDQKYNTNSSRTIIGQSLGGLLATEILFTQPTLFNKYIIISPSLWWDNGSLLQQNPSLLQAGFAEQTDIYIGVGKEGSIDGSKHHVMEEDAKILAEKIKLSRSKNIKVYFDYLPEEDHATVIHQAVFNAFRLLYPKKGGQY